jgi:lantibiotic modifying enzyme
MLEAVAPTKSQTLESLGSGFREHLRVAETLRYAELAQRQSRPWASLAFGAAGVAYALWRSAYADGGDRLERVELILREAAKAPNDDYWSPALGPAKNRHYSLYYGDIGIAYVRTLVAHARRDDATYEQQLSKFLARCETSTCCLDEVIYGTAGLLNGARILYAQTKDPRLCDIAERLSDGLLARASSGSGGWLDEHRSGFAHGASGVLHALLSWSLCLGRPAPSLLLQGLARFSAVADAGEDRAALVEPLRSSWCNGASGEVLLWARAYELTRQQRHLALARSNAHIAYATRHSPNPGLCCGGAGRAYALLAMERVDPGKNWLARAVDCSLLAVCLGRDEIQRWSSGLYSGFSGLACLFQDLTRAPQSRRGFPLIED